MLNFCLQKDNKSNARECEGQEVLHVRAYGSSFFTLGINIRFSFLTVPVNCIKFVMLTKTFSVCKLYFSLLS